MLPWEKLRAAVDRRARRRTEPSAPEALEGRELLSYTSLGYSLPDLRITGAAGTVAAWGGPLTVSALIQNIGASTIIEPLSLPPASQITTGPDGNNVPPWYTPSQSDAPSTQVKIYLTPRAHSLSGAIEIGSFTAPSIIQNDITQVTTPITLPPNPLGYPSSGTFFLRLVVNGDQTVPETRYGNNLSAPIPIRIISRSLPLLQATALDVPAVMQPGDTIAPTFQITNLGTASTAAQGPIEVALVASTSPDFNLGSSIVALYTIDQAIPAQSSAATRVRLRHHRRLFGSNAQNDNVTPGVNVLTYTGVPVTLPTSPSTYFLGIVIDPNNRLQQLSVPVNRLEQVRPVGPPVAGLPPAGVVGPALSQQFPNPPDGVPIGTVNPSTI